MNKSAVSKLVGKKIFAVHKKGGTVVGKLVKVSGTTLYIQPISSNGKKVKTNAVIPLVLFDLLAIGTSPYGYGGYPYGGYGGYGYGGYGFGGGSFFW